MTTQAATANVKDSAGARKRVYDFAEGSREMRDLAGLDDVSCSPFRPPIARVAAAQARRSQLRAGRI